MSKDSLPVQVLSIGPSRKPSALADLSIQIATELGEIVLHDCRVLKNRQGEAWFALPSFSVLEGKAYSYSPAIVLSADLKKQVTDTALEAFSAWEDSHDTSVISGGRS